MIFHRNPLLATDRYSNRFGWRKVVDAGVQPFPIIFVVL
jgi:hypothetical protein